VLGTNIFRYSSFVISRGVKSITKINQVLYQTATSCNTPSTAWYYCDSDGTDWGEPLVSYPITQPDFSVKLLGNPSTDGVAELEMESKTTRQVKLSIIDLYGNIVWINTLDEIQEGKSTFVIGTDELQAGFYFVVVETSNNFKTTFQL
jgi:Secretion system C-terminal sorting domain